MISDSQIKRTGNYEGTGPKQGSRFTPYRCPAGKLTIGRGINLDAGIDAKEEDFLFRHRLEIAYDQALIVFPKLEEMSQNRRETIVDLVFNVGLPTFLGFRKFIKAVQGERWDDAAAELMDSKWFHQVGNRAKDAVAFMKVG